MREELKGTFLEKAPVCKVSAATGQGLEELIESKTGINTMTAEDPMTAVAIGTGRYIECLSESGKE